MGPVGFVARYDLRRRWWRLVALALLVGVAGAGVLATVAGARRTSSSLRRFQASSRSADIEFAVARPSSAQLDRLARAPGVAAVGRLVAYGLVVPRAPDFYSVGARVDHSFGVTVDRDRLVAGRAPDPDVPEEVTVGEGFAARLGLHVGDRFVAESFTGAQIARTLRGDHDVGPRAGPKLALHVVGIVRRPLDLGDRAASGGLLVLTPAFARAYADRIGVFGDRLRVRTDRRSDVPRVLAAAKRIFGPSLFLAQSLAVETQGASNAIDVLAVALWIGAGVAAAASIVTIGIVLARDTAAACADLAPLGDLGCTRLQRTGAFGVAAALVAGAGAVVAVAGAVALSPVLPVGVARRADPDIGVHVDVPVLALGAVAVVGIVLMVCLGAAYRAAARDRRGVAHAGARRPTWAARLSAHGSRPSLANGVRMAFEAGGQGRGRVPVRSAFVGAILGIVGVTAALVFATSLDRLVATPSRYGATWDFTAIDTTSNTPCGAETRGLTAVAGVAALSEVCSQNVQVDGRPTPGLAYRPLRGGGVRPDVVAGRAPGGPGEVALGAKTLAALHKRVGDHVRIATRAGARVYRVVGRAVLPTVAQAQPLADGAIFTGAGYAPIFDQNIFLRTFVGRYATGSDAPAVARRIAAVPDVTLGSGPTVPVEIDRLRQIDWLPVGLAALLGVLAIAAVGHALVVGSRRRRHDLALLKVLGFTRRQVRGVVAWQATTIALVGLVVGIPLGLLVGRLVWRRVADGLGVAVDASLPLLALMLVAAVAIALVNLVAVVPAGRAARCRTATVLRTE
ncbi:MAG: FtsX-like permease family protein [Acidimicrobiia bacterium]